MIHEPLEMGEGDTPVISLPTLARYAGIPEIFVKAEWMNPTGSYKDRIAAATITDAVRKRQRGWIGTSSGNGGAAMAAYGARAGLRGFLCVAANAPNEKLVSILPYGATILPMTSLGLVEMDAIAGLAAEYDLKLSVTAYRYNPEGMSGAERIGSELLRQGSFTHVYVPTGGGGLLVAIVRGMSRRDMRAPKVVCAQPRGCNPIVQFLNGTCGAPILERCESTISGLQLPDPPDGLLAADGVRDTGGWGSDVTDEDAWAAQDLLARSEGVFVEPASALAVAALLSDLRNGRLTSRDRPIVVLTGGGFKDLRRYSSKTGLDGRCYSLADLRTTLQSELT